ncbi:MAG TPA: hypothetical protein DEB06_10375 [Phycisphaerales bacterium]|nr:hypothetical protein [Phycisphaerales bacterium]
MLVYLVRHGKAEKATAAMRDRDRPLRPRGERQSEWLAQALLDGARDRLPALILSSEFLRARETARILSERLGVELRFEQALELGWPADDALALVAREAERGINGPLLLVGHNPQMEILLSILSPDLAAADDEMKTGMAALVDVPDPFDPEGGGRLLRKLRLNDRSDEQD